MMQCLTFLFILKPELLLLFQGTNLFACVAANNVGTSWKVADYSCMGGGAALAWTEEC